MLQNLIQQDFLYLLKTAHPNTSLLVHGWRNNFNNTFIIPNITMPQQFNYMQEHLHKIENMLSPYLGAILLGLNILFLRLYLLLRWCPLVLLLGLVGLVDGLVQRNIRRASAGRESALIYHQSKALIFFSLILGVFIDLILPIQAEQSEWILVSAAILFGLAIQVTAKSFKKYL